MKDKDEFFNMPKARSRKRRGQNFLIHCLWMVMFSVIVLSASLAVVKLSGKGPALRRHLIGLLGGVPATQQTTKKEDAAKDSVESEHAVKVPVETIVEKIVEVPVEKIVEKIVEVKPPLPSSYVNWRKVDIATLWNEIPVKTEMVTKEGDTAVKERERKESYQIEMKVALTVPKPNQSAAELSAINPKLPSILKDFDSLIDQAEVSPFYHHLYQLKTERIQQHVTRIDRLLSRHNFYDLETLLQIKHPETGRKVLLAQGEMDTVSDGSDGDRWPELDDYISMSQHYQPFTSYGWPKQTSTPNPLLNRWETRLAEYEKEFAQPGLSIERNRFLRSQIDQHKAEIADLKARSYLIAEADPFIVIPLSFLGRKSENEFGPAIGDYVVVIYGDKIYPAIAGDGGPSWLFGEGSLRLAKEINEKASAYNRPVSDLIVTYLIFPNSADEKKGPPDLEKWYEKCSSLLDEIGGLGEGYSLHRWEDLVAKRHAERAAEAAAAAPSSAAPQPSDEKAASDDNKGNSPSSTTSTPKSEETTPTSQPSDSSKPDADASKPTEPTPDSDSSPKSSEEASGEKPDSKAERPSTPEN